MDGYAFLRRILAAAEERVGVVYAVALVTLVFSPFVLNDVLVLILTPALVRYARERRVDAAPLIVAEVTLTNIASALTPIGNPQNILLWTSSRVTFSGFVEGAWPYVAASAALAAVALAPFALRLRTQRGHAGPVGSLRPVYYLALVTLSVLAGDAARLPTYVPLAAGFALGFWYNRGSLRGVGSEFDLRSLAVLCALVASVTVASYYLMPYLASSVLPAARGDQPYSGLFMAATSNVISNVPATQLLIKVGGVSAAAAPKIGAEAGLAGNLGPIASFANLLALQMAAKSGVSVKRIILLQLAVGAMSFIPALL